MVIKNVNLEIVIGVTSKIPETTLPEVAFAGKSNVGKSSLINALMRRKSYARTSSQPGKTQTINFYNINELMYLVDLPGYGYAKVSESVKAKWGKMIEKYLRTSKQLKQVFLLIDIRHDPSANDKMMYDWIVENGFRPIIVATKLDKIKRSQVQKQVKAVRNGLGLRKEDVLIPFSSETKQGLEELWKYVDSYVLEDEAVDVTIEEMVDEKNSKTAEVEETTRSGSED
ncbi:ribosome biogenesis GTP-binding protein YihA/YsxC [Lachnospira pectinoschiza]|uniref:Probable GTP-binding protein EngB n=1 Tax=Lachnospira pectinoschiza TaxID=28052 RepID=A0A1G9Y658_9FIRM|nr:ribosome biogenesis GTP-binding protein YihA/YsxC [Lachnospira pectinoschiza]SDN03965.1 GTP-binding protein [Lachnospira pectinoschiza]